jgi:hypothetical protein
MHDDSNNTAIDCGCSNLLTGILAWDYPVKPGMEEWQKFKSKDEKVNACQIPESILSSLSTEDLTAICLQYPLLNNVFAFNQRSMGADMLFNDFNGIRELFEREETSKELIRHYNCIMQDLSILDGEYSDLEKGNFIISVSQLEFLLGFYSQKVDATKDMLQSLVNRYEEKCKYPDFISFGLTTNLYARAHIIARISPQSIEKIPFGYKNGVFDGWTDKETTDIINELSYQLIK